MNVMTILQTVAVVSGAVFTGGALYVSLLDTRGLDVELPDLMRRWARLHWIRSVAGVGGLLVLIYAGLHRG
jgi:hypothetical protein